MGTERVIYYLLTEEGLKDEKSGEVYYSKARVAALEEKRARKFKDNGNGTVTDNDTKLMWQQGEGGKMAWDSAIAYCKNLSLAGYNDWRLPNIEELKSIIDVEKKPAIFINKTYFPNANASRYWSSTTSARSSSDAWVVHFDFGNDNFYYKSYSYYVRCVRAGQ